MRAVSLLLVAVVVGCGGSGEAGTGGGGGVSGCGELEVPLLDGGCAALGVQNDGCPAGTLAAADGSCEEAGVPPTHCAEGFAPDDDRGCLPILPAAPCPPGEMALPGEEVCRAIVDCGEGPWGDIPVEAGTVYVDASSIGAPDGSAAAPFPTIGEAVTAAADGAMIAIAAGTYAEQVSAVGKSLRIWGRCPTMVAIDPPPGALAIAAGQASSVELHQLATSGDTVASVVISAVAEARVGGLWIRDSTAFGLLLTDELGPIDGVVVSNTLVENSGGIFVDGAGARIERTVIRDTVDIDNGAAVGLTIARSQHTGVSKPAEVDRVIVERAPRGLVRILATDVTMTASVIREPLTFDDVPWGSGILVDPDEASGVLASLDLSGSLIERTGLGGLVVLGGEVSVRDTTFQDGVVVPTEVVTLGHGLLVQPPLDLAIGSVVEARHLRIRRQADTGLSLGGGTAQLEGLWVSDTQARIDGKFGHGFDLAPAEGLRPAATIVGTRVTASLGIGVSNLAGDLVLDGVVVEDTAASPATGRTGIGVLSWTTPEGQEASLTLHASQVLRSREFGVLGTAGPVSVTSSLISDTQDDGVAFGDGVAAIQSIIAPTSVDLWGSVVRASSRAGISTFGTTVTLADSEIQCAPIAIAAEAIEDLPGTVVDGGGNRCGCEGMVESCKAQSTALQPPSPPSF